jgi:yersiniabactin nonribosomal peptide synthetase
MNAVPNDFALEAPLANAARGRDLVVGEDHGLGRWHRVRKAVLRFERASLPGKVTVDSLRREVAELLEVPAEELGDDDDLSEWGLDSVRLMSLVNRWQVRGAAATFPEMASAPRLSAWVQLLRQPGASPDQPGLPADVVGPFPLTPVQHAYWVGRGAGLPLGEVACHFYVEFESVFLDRGVLEAAVQGLLQRHPMLSARFHDDGTQSVPDRPRVHSLVVNDWRGLDPEESARQRLLVRDRLSHRRHDVAAGEVIGFELSLLPKGVVLHFDIDLLVADVLSIRLLLRDLAAAMQGSLRPPAARASFAQYLAWRDQRDQSLRQIDAAYWLARVGRLPAPPPLPLAQDPARLRAVRFERRSTWLDAASVQTMQHLAQQAGVTLPIAFLTAYALVLSRWSGCAHFILSVPVFDRLQPTPDIAEMVADFTDLIVLEVDLRARGTFAQSCRQQQRAFREAMAHRAFSGVEILRELGRRGLLPAGIPAVFTSAVGLGELIEPEVRRTLGTPAYMISQTPQVWLDHQVVEHDGGLLINWDGVRDLLAPGVAQAMFEAYERLLEGLMDAAQWERAPELELPLQQRSVRALANATAAPLPQGLLQDAFVAQAHSRPQAVALCWQEQGSCSYGQLLRQVQAVAQLLQAQGVGAGDLVGLTLDKGPLQVAAVLGVLAVGAAYVPVGVEQPVQRRRRIYDDAKVRLVLTQREQRDALQTGVSQPVHALPEQGSDAPLPRLQLDAQALAYVIYTSGSTGEPKGVRISHGAALNTVQEVNRRWQVQAQDRVLGVSALDFDLSVYDIFGPLSVGAALVLPLEAQRRDAHAWQGLMRRWEVSVWNSVPALLEMLLSVQHEERSLSSLRLALLSGDWIALDLPRRLRAVASGSGCRFVGLGGATEAAIWSNAVELEEAPPGWSSIPYGWPLANQGFRVVDALGQDCPDWVQGELWIGGAGVAQGYHEDPQRSASRFVLHEGQRWYRTGDLGRYRPDGCLEFLGRADQQVKVKGHRIELGEVEAALRRHAAVSDAAVLALGERQRTLAAAVVVDQASGLTLRQLQEFAQEHLPGYAVPAQWLVLERLPLTGNGKVDRRELHRLCVQQQQQALQPREQDAPQGALEQELAALWCALLSLPAVQRSDHFMSLGGDSLLATRMIEQLRQRWHVSLGIDLFLRAPTVAALAAQLQALRDPAVEEGIL